MKARTVAVIIAVALVALVLCLLMALRAGTGKPTVNVAGLPAVLGVPLPTEVAFVQRFDAGSMDPIAYFEYSGNGGAILPLIREAAKSKRWREVEWAQVQGGLSPSPAWWPTDIASDRWRKFAFRETTQRYIVFVVSADGNGLFLVDMSL